MTYIIIFFAFAFLIGFVIQQIAKFVLRNFYSKKSIQKEANPYIEYHKLKMINDDRYEEYLEWIKNKEVYGTVVEKVEDEKEKQATKKAQDLVPRKKLSDDDWNKLLGL